MSWSPGSRMLEELVAGHLGLTDARGFVEPASPSAPAPFRINVVKLLGTATESAARSVAQQLQDMRELDVVEARPPGVFVGLMDSVLRAAWVGPHQAQEPLVDSQCVVSFGNPNANKPLHLGHLRICFIGMSLARLLEDAGHSVVRCQMVSDYGIHITQAALAYEKWASGHTPDVSGEKPDHFVGRLYGMYHRELGEADLQEASRLRAEASDLLVAMESGDSVARAANRLITGWARDGIAATYRRIGTFHDNEFLESETLAVGKQVVAAGLESGVFHHRNDGSVAIDLADCDLGEVTVLRGDGTPLVYTQFLGTFVSRETQLPDAKVILVTGDQWTWGGDVLWEMLRRCGHEQAGSTEPVYIGMVRTPAGPLRSRARRASTADGILDELERYFQKTGCGDPGTWSSAVPELAVAYIKWVLLGVRRTSPVVIDEEALFEQEREQFNRVVNTLAWCQAPPSEGSEGWNGADVKAVLSALDRFPLSVARARQRRDPSELVRGVDHLCRAVTAVAESISGDAELLAQVREMVGRGLDLLDISLTDVQAASRAVGGSAPLPDQS